MKILNSTRNNETTSEDELIDSSSSLIGIQTTPVSELMETTQLTDGSLIHIVDKNEDKYESRKMQVQTFKNKIFEAVNNEFKTEYNELIKNDLNDDDDSNDAHGKWDSEFDPSTVEMTFPEHVKNDIEHVYSSLNGRLTELEGTTVETSDYLFESDMVLTTTRLNNQNDKDDKDNIEISHESVNHNKNENDTYCQMEIKDGNKISNTWTCPETGILVVQGWLDSSAALNNKAIPTSFCVIEGNINGRWEILGVNSVIPAKNITYVGFTLPVKKNLDIRTRTGFTVGAKSSQFSNEQDGWDTLSNSTANGFKCLIFSGKEQV